MRFNKKLIIFLKTPFKRLTTGFVFAIIKAQSEVVMRRKHNGKIYFPHYEETWLADTLTTMVKRMQETGHLYYVEWNGEFYYSDEVKIDGNSVMCEGKND